MTTTQPVRQLRRRTQDRILAGVCGGVADYVGVDVVVIRILVVLLTVLGGSGLIIYLLAWLLIPAQDQPQSLAEDLLRR